VIRILRAFAWMRWRVFVNSLERTGARDTLERLSLAVDQLGPIIAALLLIPSLIGMSALSGFAGYALATRPEGALAFQVLRYLAVAATILSIVGPIVLPGQDRTNPVRLLLLPIPRSTLYLAQAAGALADPWTLVFLPVTIFLPVGLLAGGHAVAAVMAFAAAGTFLAVLIGLSTLTSSVVQIVLRDRRRGELVALVFILVLPLVGMLTSSFDPDRTRRHRGAPEPATAAGPALTERVMHQAFAAAPSERFVAATEAAVQGRTGASLQSWLILAATAAILHGTGLLALARILAFPGSVSRRRSGGRGTAAAWRLPLLSPGASAVAMAQVRLTLRTPRGRSTLFSPLMVCVALGVLATRGGSHFPQALTTGLGLAMAAAVMSIMTSLPLVTNQFAIDGAGLTLELLSPLAEEDILDGKALAGALLSAAPACVALAVAMLVYPGGDLASWASIPLGMAGTWMVLAPAAAALAAMFPKVVDLNSIGNRSNAHGVANLAGLFLAVLSALPPIGLAVLARAVLDRPALTPILLLAWLAVAFAINRAAARPLRALLASRRENLALTVG
jgi:hypothetical protein